MNLIETARSWMTRPTLRGVASAALSAVAIVAIAAAALVLVVPRAAGGTALTVLSSSMEPTYPVGSLLVVRQVDPADVAVGDAITYQNSPNNPSFTTHRVVEIETTSDGLAFVTKGDANRGNDDQPVPAGAVRARAWFHVPHLGRLRDLAATPMGLGLLALIATGSLLMDRLPTRRRVAAASAPEAGQASGDTEKTALSSAPAATDSRTEPVPQHGPEAPTLAAPPTIREDVAPADPVRVAGATVELQPMARVEQQFLLAHLNAGVFERGNVLEILGLVRGQVVTFGPRHMVVSVSGTPEHLDGVEKLLRPFGLVQAQRSDVIHVGDEPTFATTAEETSEASTRPAETFSALALAPPPPHVTFMGAPANGRSREWAGQ